MRCVRMCFCHIQPHSPIRNRIRKIEYNGTVWVQHDYRRRDQDTLSIFECWLTVFACAAKKRCRLNYYGHRQSTHSKSFLFTPLGCVSVSSSARDGGWPLPRRFTWQNICIPWISRQEISFCYHFPSSEWWMCVCVSARPWRSLFVCVCKS